VWLEVVTKGELQILTVMLVLARERRQACWNLWAVERWEGSRAMRPSTAGLKMPSGRRRPLAVSGSSHGANRCPRIISIACKPHTYVRPLQAPAADHNLIKFQLEMPGHRTSASLVHRTDKTQGEGEWLQGCMRVAFCAICDLVQDARCMIYAVGQSLKHV
jgi:hypothetical protein